MTSRTLSARAWALWLGACIAIAGALAMSQAPAKTVRAHVRPIPAITGHILGPESLTPLTTSQCLARKRPIHCYQPFQIQNHYNLAPLYAEGLNGAGQTIVIVDSFGSPTIAHDLHVFDQTFALSDPVLTIAAPAGPIPPFNPDDGDMIGWAAETTLDVEWAHVVAPGANILLLETPVSETEGVQGFPEIVAAENWAIDHNLGDVISQSFGATEETFPGPLHHNAAILRLRSSFKNAARHHVTVLAASGDTGATDPFTDGSCCYPYPVISWPSSDPLVTSLGGTQLTMNDAGETLAPDVAWNGGGGGLSKVFDRPGFQNHVRGVVGKQRGVPDISMSASFDGAVTIYTSFGGISPGYHLIAGTSEATPIFAGVVAIADQIRGERVGNINQELYRLGREHASGIVDVTSGNNTFKFLDANQKIVTVTGFNAVPGYDLATGWGTVDANMFCRQLAGEDQQGNSQDDNSNH